MRADPEFEMFCTPPPGGKRTSVRLVLFSALRTAYQPATRAREDIALLAGTFGDKEQERR